MTRPQETQREDIPNGPTGSEFTRQIPDEPVQLEPGVPPDVLCLHIQCQQIGSPKATAEAQQLTGNMATTEACDSSHWLSLADRADHE